MFRNALSLNVAALVCAALSPFAALSATAAGVNATAQAAASAEGFSNSAAFNGGFGMGPAQQNQAISGSNRDANGNLVIVNGILSGSGSVSQQSGGSQSGTGVGGTSATAIGNNLNVTVTGTWNTVIVDSQQNNTGNQSANATLNGNLKF